MKNNSVNHIHVIIYAVLSDSELILDSQNKVYHLHLNGDQIADTVFLVGDPDRVAKVSALFSKIEHKEQHREFITHTGYFEGHRISVISTGIGTDNIDIVLNELDAAVNIDLKKRAERSLKRSLNLIRLGTCGALQNYIPVNALIASVYGLGIDGLMNFYKNSPAHCNKALEDEFIRAMNWPPELAKPYAFKASEHLLKQAHTDFLKGITVTAPGFYAPQGRQIRLPSRFTDLPGKLSNFHFGELKITNFEMETSALYGLGSLLGHRCLTVCVVIANRMRGEFAKNLQQSEQQLIETCLNQFSNL